MALPDTACMRCVLYSVSLARLLDAKGMEDESERLLERDSPGREYPTDVFWELYRARLAARRGDSRAASRSYRFVRDGWIRGDAALQPYVREAREALVRANERD